jgi:hypothetical protein
MQMDTKTRETSLTKFMRQCRWFSGITAAVTVFFFLSTYYFVPCAYAVDQAHKAEKARNQYHPKGRSDEEKLANTLQDIKEHVAERKSQVQNKRKTQSNLVQDFLNLFGLSSLATEELDRLNAMTEQAANCIKRPCKVLITTSRSFLCNQMCDKPYGGPTC